MRGQPQAPAALYPGKDPVPVVHEAGWSPVPVWTGAENLATTGIRPPNRPARNQSLYPLSYGIHESTSYFGHIYLEDELWNSNSDLINQTAGRSSRRPITEIAPCKCDTCYTIGHIQTTHKDNQKTGTFVSKLKSCLPKIVTVSSVKLADCLTIT